VTLDPRFRASEPLARRVATLRAMADRTDPRRGRDEPDDPFSQIFDPKFVESAQVREASARERARWAKNTRRKVKVSKARRNAGAAVGSYAGGVLLLGGLTLAIYAIRDYYNL
jgi:hypothetical protein